MVIMWILLIWAFLGIIVISMMEKRNTSNISTKKASVLIFASGPVIWLYTLYRCLR